LIEQYCDECGEEKEFREQITGAEQLVCPNCWDDWKVQKYDLYRCRACWRVKECLAHHISYVPEKVVPVCYDCHGKIHSERPLFDHLKPERGRLKEIEIIGLEDTEYKPAGVETRIQE